MHIRTGLRILFWLALVASNTTHASTTDPKIVHFQSHGKLLGGELFKPSGTGPFPVVLYNHGSAPGMLNSQASKLIGPLFAEHGWIFFMPYRRGQGLSAEAGRYIGDEIDNAEKHSGIHAASVTMTTLLGGDHLEDQLAAFAWIRSEPYVQKHHIAVAGNSFGGVEAVLGAAKAPYCAAVVASGGAESWDESPELQNLMKSAVRAADSPMLFFQAANDFNLAPSQVLVAERKQVGKITEVKTYPAFGSTPVEGHGFAYRGAEVWFPDVYKFLQKSCL